MITLPQSNICVLAPVPDLDYFNSQSVAVTRDVTPLEFWNTEMTRPQPVMNVAFWVRDAVSSLFGVRKIGGFSGVPVARVTAGDRLDFFVVEHADDTTLVLTERDRHLDVMTCISTEGVTVCVTSSVRVHNGFGRAYMIPVAVAHKWIVRRSLCRFQRQIASGG